MPREREDVNARLERAYRGQADLLLSEIEDLLDGQRRRSRRPARRPWLLLLSLLSFLPVAAGCHRPPPNLDSPGTTIVCLGDSITAGVGASAGHGYVDVLAERLGRPVVNAGVSGNTAAEGLARLPQVIEQSPWLVIVELGGNDILRQVPMERTEEDLSQIVQKLLEARALPVLVAVGGPFSGRRADMYDRVGDRFRVPVVRGVLRQILLDPALKADEVHPNDQGHARLAAAIAEAVEPLLAERQKRYGR